MRKTYRISRQSLAAMAFANCAMILENAMAMPDSYIEQHYGNDSGMCSVAEQYFDFGCKILTEKPECGVDAITRDDFPLYRETELGDDGE